MIKKRKSTAKGRYAEGNPSNLWIGVRTEFKSYMYNGSKSSKERYDKAYEDYKKSGGTRPRPKWYYGC